ncbi:hypothetical protein Rsub_10320 [Raphidocelis subcapitata]|uniref:Uncharacterized protein n=1 Tax=Raphidocelis subcapitata TaxID=307507 RepID=A0A2V0PGU2_9CHLO|nr:hypothetical protein Rsub_10320 [Raphidocelis subcapitata]|eukprot:GBF97133.1 hypothetical protein Rsub_10320 [Raphidocelis subcapitata]
MGGTHLGSAAEPARRIEPHAALTRCIRAAREARSKWAKPAPRGGAPPPARHASSAPAAAAKPSPRTAPPASAASLPSAMLSASPPPAADVSCVISVSLPSAKPAAAKCPVKLGGPKLIPTRPPPPPPARAASKATPPARSKFTIAPPPAPTVFKSFAPESSAPESSAPKLPTKADPTRDPETAPPVNPAPKPEAPRRGPAAEPQPAWAAEWSYDTLMALSISSTADSLDTAAPPQAAGGPSPGDAVTPPPPCLLPSPWSSGSELSSGTPASDGLLTTPCFDDVALASDDGDDEAPLLSEAGGSSSSAASDGGAGASDARGAGPAPRKVRRVTFEAIAAKAAALFPPRAARAPRARGAGDSADWAPLLESGSSFDAPSAPIRFEPFVLRGAAGPSPARRVQRWFAKRLAACFGAAGDGAVRCF